MATEGCSIKDQLDVTFGSIYLFLSLVGLIEHGFLLYLVKRDPLRQFNKPTNVINIATGLNYLFSSIIWLPFIGITSILKSQHIIEEPSYVITLFEDFFVSFFASNGTMLSLALFIERATAFVFPLLNRQRVTITRAKRICAVISGTCFLFCCILFTGIPKSVFYFVFLPLFILLPSLGLLVLPAAGYCALKCQARKVSTVKRNERLSCPANDKKENARVNFQAYRYLLESTKMTVFVILNLVNYSVLKFVESSDVEVSCFTLFKHLSYFLLFLPVTFLPIVLVRKIPAFSRSAKHILRRR